MKGTKLWSIIELSFHLGEAHCSQITVRQISSYLIDYSPVQLTTALQKHSAKITQQKMLQTLAALAQAYGASQI